MRALSGCSPLEGSYTCASRSCETNFGTCGLELLGEGLCLLFGDFLLEPDWSAFHGFLCLFEPEVEDGPDLLNDFNLGRGVILAQLNIEVSLLLGCLFRSCLGLSRASASLSLSGGTTAAATTEGTHEWS